SRAAFEYQAILPFAFTQLGLRAFAVADIARIDHYPRNLRVIQPVLAHHFQVTPRTILPAATEFLRNDLSGIFEGAFKRTHRGRQILRVYQSKRVLARYFLRLITQHRLERRTII